MPTFKPNTHLTVDLIEEISTKATAAKKLNKKLFDAEDQVQYKHFQRILSRSPRVLAVLLKLAEETDNVVTASKEGLLLGVELGFALGVTYPPTESQTADFQESVAKRMEMSDGSVCDDPDCDSCRMKEQMSKLLGRKIQVKEKDVIH
jgi:hypothetical protein